MEVGSIVTFVNPSDENQAFDLTVVGIYSDTESNSFSSMFGSSQDPANKIYMSANTVNAIVEQSKAASEEDGKELSSSLSATYVIGDLDGYYKFEEEVRTLGLDENYTVSSPDLTSYENSLTPLKTLSTMAGWFLVIIFIIGGVILVVLNIFNIRERKYEIGVLTRAGLEPNCLGTINP